MPSDEPTILSSELAETSSNPASSEDQQSPRSGRKKILLALAFIIFFVILAVAVFFIGQKYHFFSQPAKAPASPAPTAATSAASSTSPGNLPDLNALGGATSSDIVASSTSTSVEYLTFGDFYKAPDNKISPQINDYELPLNVKIEVMNYYDVSRKLNLDPGLDSLNKNGFATIVNPWPQAAPDFYSLYSNLNSRQLPLMITSDFLLYYYQNIFKKVFKDVEENVFYDNLWDINKEMYTVAKNRYEARLAAIGDINDSVLEGERLETAFFAVALELLKPAADQIAAKGAADSGGLFVSSEASHFYFVVPPYLRDDVLAEVKLIRDSRAQTKSPVMLYPRNYSDFTVPVDYLANAKLNNFYLTTKWLNSVFPLNYRAKDCPSCLLDKADWRINLTAASLISQDFSSLSDVKNKWARIYKVMSFFKGLREELDYVHYRDSLAALFGTDYDIEKLFDDQNKDGLANLEKLRGKLASYDFPEISGALIKSDPATRAKLGFKMLAEPYWPNSYIFSRLVSPVIGSYAGTSTKPYNVTACLDRTNEQNKRCNGFALDTINLVYPIGNNDYFAENTNYADYSRVSQELRTELSRNSVWHLNNYWTTLSLLKAYLSMPKTNLPLFARSAAWQDQSLKTAAAAWINLQLPLEKFSVAPVVKGQNLDDFSRWSENSYIEPNLDLLNEMTANDDMILKMFSALQLDSDVRPALQDVRNFSDSLNSLKKIVVKELSGEKLGETDNELITDFTKQLQISMSPLSAKQLAIKLPTQKSVLREDLSRLKLLVLIHREGDNKVFSVGPVWDYQESH